jgi:hypothetical protein
MIDEDSTQNGPDAPSAVSMRAVLAATALC